MVLEKKASARVEAGQRRVLDEATRQRRLTRQLEALEKDNFQDDPLSSLPPPGPTARLPAFSETEEPEKKKRKTRGDHFKQRFRKNFTTLLEEETLSLLQEVTVTLPSPRRPEELLTYVHHEAFIVIIIIIIISIIIIIISSIRNSSPLLFISSSSSSSVPEESRAAGSVPTRVSEQIWLSR
ncbi:zinc finger HIT domain-containing protein 1 isoform X4 [Sander lucioperca]|uniref:zinc finger HIT domain-containing protein 1 isoform X4 n=1 Tax=Sander lucioperca TaxID=283035 RepID=UPI001653D385|nr:zinc finger HIT domain-containing protein 1 isoform X4 [Sander lucioperca]